MTQAEALVSIIIATARERGPWHIEPDGRIRNAKGSCPYHAATGRWLRASGEPFQIDAIIEAADLPKSKHRALLMERLGMQ